MSKDNSNKHNGNAISKQHLASRDAMEKYLEENGIMRTRKTGGILIPFTKVQSDAVKKSCSNPDKDG